MFIVIEPLHAHHVQGFDSVLPFFIDKEADADRWRRHLQLIVQLLTVAT